MGWLDAADAPEFVQRVSRWREGAIPGAEALSELEKIERKHRVLLVPRLPYEVADGQMVVRGDPRFEPLQDADDETLTRLFRERLFPFLSETWALLLCAFPDGSDVVLEGRYFFHGTARAYARAAAEWANGVHWLGRADWDYRELLYGQSFDADYHEWLRALLRLVCERSARRPAG